MLQCRTVGRQLNGKYAYSAALKGFPFHAVLRHKNNHKKDRAMQSHAYSTSNDSIPQSVRVFTWVLIAAGLFFAYVYTFNPGLVFPGAQITDYSSKLGFASTGVRVLGSVAALLISVLYNRPQWLLITLISRLFIESGDIVVGFATGGTMTNNVMIGIVAALELWAILTLLKASR